VSVYDPPRAGLLSILCSRSLERSIVLSRLKSYLREILQGQVPCCRDRLPLVPKDASRKWTMRWYNPQFPLPTRHETEETDLSTHTTWQLASNGRNGSQQPHDLAVGIKRRKQIRRRSYQIPSGRCRLRRARGGWAARRTSCAEQSAPCPLSTQLTSSIWRCGRRPAGLPSQQLVLTPVYAG
jgi:hypothetical protein